MGDFRPMVGEIWTYQIRGRESFGESDGLILAVHGEYSTVLRLQPVQPRENGMEIQSRCMMWSDLGKPAFVYHNQLGDLVKQIPEKQLFEIRRALAGVLGLDEPEVIIATPAEAGPESAEAAAPHGGAEDAKPEPEESDQQPDDADGPSCTEGGVSADAVQEAVENARIRAERDVYRQVLDCALLKLCGVGLPEESVGCQ